MQIFQILLKLPNILRLILLWRTIFVLFYKTSLQIWPLYKKKTLNSLKSRRFVTNYAVFLRFHGRLQRGREEAEELLHTYAYLGDGTFLVRTSVTFVGEYCLSFLRNGQVNHCRIRSKPDRQQIKYFLTDTKYFDSLYSLITHYRTYPLVTPEFSITLNEPVPQPKKHETEAWYYSNLTKTQSEDILSKITVEGAFLVRPSENEANCYTISFRWA